MTKRFDLDAGKRRARRRFKDFLKPRLVNRKTTFVLCFPGEQGFEIEQVYRPLGIRDENIWGVERDKKAAAVIAKRYPKINLYVGELWDFVSSYDGPAFSVISLDYCGNFSEEKIRPFWLLDGNEKIAPRCVIAVNLMAGRELQDDQQTLRGLHTRIQIRNEFNHALPISAEDAVGLVQEGAKTDLYDARSDGLTESLMSTFGYLMPALRTNYVCNLGIAKGSTIGLSSKTAIRYTDEHMVLDNAIKVDHKKNHIQNAQATKHLAIQDVNKELHARGIVEDAKLEAERLKIPPDFFEYHLGRTLVMAFYDLHGETNFPVAVDRISYISDTGRRMVSDFIELRRLPVQPEVGVTAFQDPDNPESSIFGLHPDPMDFPSKRAYLDFLKRIVKRYAETIAMKLKEESYQWPEREDLGGGDTIPVNVERLRERARDLFKKGRSVEEVIEKVPLLPLDEIELLSGKFTGAPVQAPVVALAVTKPDKKKETRRQVLELIREGWTTDDILELVPGVSKGTVAAIRAHVTMKTYEEKAEDKKRSA